MCRFRKPQRRVSFLERRPSRAGVQGFSLIEVLVAMTILATGILGVLSAFSLSGRTGNRAFRLEQAALLAERELELAMHLPSGQQPMTGSDGPYTWQLAYASRPHDLAVVRIEVQWLDRGQTRSFELERAFVPRPDQ